jgi:hypothetical protein
MKTFLSATFAIIIASSFAHGWVSQEPIDYSKQLQKADFVGIVEVTKIFETGQKKLMSGYNVQFREVRLEMKVLSAFKGRSETLTCKIYREPTKEELLADGVTKEDVMKILLNLWTDESLQLFPARVAKGANLLAYLRSDGTEHIPVDGDLDSSRSLLSLEPSNRGSDLPRKQEAEQDATSNGEKPPN